MKPRTKRAPSDLGRQHTGALEAAVGAAHPLAAVLAHAHRDLRQLLDLMARRLPDRDTLDVGEHVAAAATLRPMIDQLVNRPRRQQLATMTLMTGLATLRASRAILPAPTRRHTRRILARRQRRIPRVTPQLTLELLDPRLKLPNPAIHRQQHLNHSLTARVVDRLSLSALHTPTFDAPESCPPYQLNAYREVIDLQVL